MVILGRIFLAMRGRNAPVLTEPTTEGSIEVNSGNLWRRNQGRVSENQLVKTVYVRTQGNKDLCVSLRICFRFLFLQRELNGDILGL